MLTMPNSFDSFYLGLTDSIHSFFASLHCYIISWGIWGFATPLITLWGFAPVYPVTEDLPRICCNLEDLPSVHGLDHLADYSINYVTKMPLVQIRMSNPQSDMYLISSSFCLYSVRPWWMAALQPRRMSCDLAAAIPARASSPELLLCGVVPPWACDALCATFHELPLHAAVRPWAAARSHCVEPSPSCCFFLLTLAELAAAAMGSAFPELLHRSVLSQI